MGAGGAPPYYKEPKELDDKIIEFFQQKTGDKDFTPTLSGLALYLGFESRQSLYDYEKNPKFSYTIKRARLRIESEYEKALHKQTCTGAIFALKNLGWSDKQELDNKISGGITIKWEDPPVHPGQGEGSVGDLQGDSEGG